MKVSIKPFAILFAICVLCSNQLCAQQSTREIDDAAHELYSRLTFNDGKFAHSSKLKEFCVEGTRFIANFDSLTSIMTVDQFISNVHKRINEQGVTGVEEKEIFSKTDMFGAVAQRLSTYEVRIQSKDKSTTRRGVNLIQFVKVNGTWKVSSIIWDRESERLRIPSEYLPN